MEKAVAIQYTEDLPAPIILARGKGELAERIKQIALEHDIQVMDNPELTDALVELPVGSLIPEDYYKIIAELLVYVRTISKV